MILWLDLFLQLFVQALAVCLAGVSTLGLCLAVFFLVLRIYAATPRRRRP